jgi:hypothetical protein
MSTQIVDNFQLNVAKPIDSRMVTYGAASRNAIQYPYEGLRVYDVQDQKPYVYIGGAWKAEKEVASGMNDNRRELNKIFNDLDSKNFTLIIENKDRLTRFGFRYIEKFIYSKNSKLIVINSSDDDQQDLMKDLISIITSFCCRIYGLRRGANKARNIKNSIVNI